MDTENSAKCVEKEKKCWASRPQVLSISAMFSLFHPIASSSQAASPPPSLLCSIVRNQTNL